MWRGPTHEVELEGRPLDGQLEGGVVLGRSALEAEVVGAGVGGVEDAEAVRCALGLKVGPDLRAGTVTPSPRRVGTVAQDEDSPTDAQCVAYDTVTNMQEDNLQYNTVPTFQSTMMCVPKVFW